MSWRAFADGRSPPESDGRFSSVPLNASVEEPPPSKRGAGDGAEPDERLRELEVRHPDAVARPAAVGDHEQDPSVGELADTGARGARRQLAGREGLVGAEDRAAAADEHRAAADGVRDPGPLRPEDEPQRQLGADRRLFGEPRRGGAARDEHCAVTGDRRAARACNLDHRAVQVGVRRRRRERGDDDLGGAGSLRRRRAVAGREERERVCAGRLVEVVQRAPLAEPAPGAEELDPADVECAFGRARRHSSGRRTAGCRRRRRA